ncbi:MAG: methionine--tRNA ligase [Elusimicrobiaceae bacterium]|nr:methionine--tRNA ligase [Elusimicrobiaceae bacterium]
METKKYYITTPLYYINADPHIGHAYTTLAADILARHLRAQGRQVHFLTGTDEHGANIEKIAREKKVGPQAWADTIAARFAAMWELLDIRYDDFIRTTQPRHEEAVKLVFENLLEQGDIYKGSYEGLYCYPCENYWEEKDLKPGNLCPVHGKPLQSVKEDTYFFRLSKYENALLNYFEGHPEFLLPKNRSQEIINFVKDGLQDVSVSRSKVAWGIPIRSDPSHTIYVWFEALLNYATAVGYGERLAHSSEDKAAMRALTGGLDMDRYWPADYHLMGKEIYRFHAVIWPAMLLALGLPLPRRVFAHGWWTVNGEKMSKSRGNFVDPAGMAAKYGVDALRYFLFREVPFGGDGDFSVASFRQRYNSDLANDLGNLLNRITNMSVKYLGGTVPEPAQDSAMPAQIAETDSAYNAHMQRLEFDMALNRVWALISGMNRLIDREQPWAKAKTEPEKLPAIFGDLAAGMLAVSGWLAPFMPGTAEKIRASLRGPDGKIQVCPPLFPRLADEAAGPAK